MKYYQEMMRMLLMNYLNNANCSQMKRSRKEIVYLATQFLVSFCVQLRFDELLLTGSVKDEFAV